MKTRVLTVLALAATSILAACHRPHGAMLSWTGGSYTYYSTETQPKSVRVVDQRTNEDVFAMDIPPGKQLTIQFEAGSGDDPVYTPDSMRYEVMDLGTETGKLSNMMSVPGADARRIVVDIRPGPEYVSPVPERMLRTDEVGDRPDWWSPRGGEIPANQRGIENYDK